MRFVWFDVRKKRCGRSKMLAAAEAAAAAVAAAVAVAVACLLPLLEYSLSKHRVNAVANLKAVKTSAPAKQMHVAVQETCSLAEEWRSSC